MDYDDEYETVFPLPFWVVLLAGLIICLPGCATVTAESHPGYDGPPMVLHTQGGDMVRLTSQPCPNSNGWLTMNKADMLYQGKNYEACWFVMGTYVVVMDSNGDVSPIPAQAFKRDEGV